MNSHCYNDIWSFYNALDDFNTTLKGEAYLTFTSNKGIHRVGLVLDGYERAHVEFKTIPNNDEIPAIYLSLLSKS